MFEDPTHTGLYLRTFGGAELEDSEAVIDLQPKPFALLVLLRLYPSIGRRELEGFLWRGLPGDASNSLSQALSQLRRFFPDLPRGKGAFVWPGRERLRCDVDVLIAAEENPGLAWDAVFSYRGAFLRGFRTEDGEAEFRKWVEQRRAEYEALFRRLWQQEVTRAETEERWDALERLGRHVASFDPLWQPGHTVLVRALACRGEGEAARNWFDIAQSQLKDAGIPLDPQLADAGECIPHLAETARKPDPASSTPVWPVPPRRRHGWRTVVGVTGVVAALCLLLLWRRSATAPPARSTASRGAVETLCGPGQARAALVDQDYKADPMNVVPPHTHFTTVWHLQNVGPCAWPASLRLHRLGAKPLSISDRDIPAQRVVAPGDTIQFPSPMLAPNDTGVFGESWILMEENGRRVPLEERDVLAARIRVLSGPPPPCQASDVVADLETKGFPDESPVRPGERSTYEWTFMNRGTGCAWDGRLSLRFVAATPARITDSTVSVIPIESRVPASQGYTFEIPMKAPIREGLYAETWRLVYGNGRVVPVQGDSVVSFRLNVRSNLADIPLPARCKRGEYAVAWLGTERPQDGVTIPAGGHFMKRWTLANKGSCTWDRGLRLVYAGAQNGERALSRADILLTRPVAPRSSYTFTVPIQVPPTPGVTYREYWAVVDPFGDTASVSLVKAFWTEIEVGPRRP